MSSKIFPEGAPDIQRKGILPQLDWLRFLAAFMVVLKHSKDTSWVSYSMMDEASRANIITKIIFLLTRYGFEAVIVFFVLSGYLVGGATFKRLGTGKFDIGDYAADRVSRILLPLIPAILIAAGVEYTITHELSWWTVAGNLASLQGIAVPSMLYSPPLWTLSYEVWFYIVNGAIASIAMRSRNIVLPMCVLSGGLAIFSFLRVDYLCIWYIGAIFGWMNIGNKSTSNLVFSIAAFLAFVVITDIAIVKNDTSHFARMSIFSLSISSLLMVREMAKFEVVERSIWKIGTYLSSFSYSLYLIHYPVLFMIQAYFPKNNHMGYAEVSRFFISVAASLISGYLFYAAFEKHTPKLRKFLRKLSGRSVGEELVVTIARLPVLPLAAPVHNP